MNGYISAMTRLDNGDEIPEREKHDCVCDILAARLGITLAEDSKLVGEISDRIGAICTERPMPVASTDSPESIVRFYNDLIRPSFHFCGLSWIFGWNTTVSYKDA